MYSSRVLENLIANKDDLDALRNQGAYRIQRIMHYSNSATLIQFQPIHAIILPIEALRPTGYDRNLWRVARIAWVNRLFNIEVASFTELEEVHLEILAGALQKLEFRQAVLLDLMAEARAAWYDKQVSSTEVV